ncbi:MAG: hypothetical protein R2772_01115 [Chitinophagales bacterium]
MSYLLFLYPLLIFLLGYFLFPKVIDFATNKNYLDEAKGRKRHAESVPPIGGWLLYAAFAVVFLSQMLIPQFDLKNLAVFASVSAMFFLGFVDDKYPLNASQKFLWQFLIATIFVFIGDIHFAAYLNFYGVPLFLAKFICVVLTVFIVNSFNLVDGINGLAALLGIVALAYLGLWLFSAAQYSMFLLSLSLIAALLVFLRYNVFQTKVFLGDNGSMLIGLLASYFVFVFIKTYSGFSNLVLTKCNAEIGVALSAIAIPLADTLRLFILRPLYLAKSPFKADRNHVHHLLIRLGFSHIEASLSLFALAILLVLAALAAQDLGSIAVIMINLFICVAFLISLDFFVFSKYRRRVDKKTVFNSLQNLSKELNNPVFIEYAFAISIFLLAISIPFHRVSTSIPTLILLFSLLMLFVRNFLLYRRDYWKLFGGKLLDFLKQSFSILVMVYLSFILIHSFFIVPSSNFQKLGIYSLLLIYWLSLFQLEKIIQIKPRVLLTAFIAGCMGFGVYILLQSFIEYPKAGWDGFYYTRLLSHVKANPVTHSLYYNLAILFLANNYKYLKKEAWKLTYFLALFFFIFIVILCSSKVGYFILLFTVPIAFYSLLNNTKGFLVFIFSYISLVAFLAFSNEVFSKDFILSALDSRLIVWEQSIGIIKENFFWGTGVGSSVQALADAFEKINYERGILQHYNAQNQFLESFMETGILGFLLLISFFIYSYLVAWKQRNKLYFVYTCIILCYMMTESLFQTQMGMVSFAFFNALFLASFYQKKQAK